jgi:hypothetical protein
MVSYEHMLKPDNSRIFSGLAMARDRYSRAGALAVPSYPCWKKFLADLGADQAHGLILKGDIRKTQNVDFLNLFSMLG